MAKFKVEFIQTKKYVVDVVAKTEDEATKKAFKVWEDVRKMGTEHYHENGDTVFQVDTIYDVTNTDDPFNAE